MSSPEEMAETWTVQQARKVWVVLTDLTEGKGFHRIKHVCEIEATARRLAKGVDVQGCDAPVEERMSIKVNGKWYYPGELERPTQTDSAVQLRMETAREVEAKALAAGLSEEDLAILRRP